MSICGLINCTNTSSTDLIQCKGICNKAFHPICIGLSRNAKVYLHEYVSVFWFLCEECKTITLSHLMLAIKCNNQQLRDLTDSVAVLKSEFLVNSNKLIELISENADSQSNTLETYAAENKSSFQKINESIRKNSNSYEHIYSLISSLNTGINKIANRKNIDNPKCSLASPKVTS